MDDDGSDSLVFGIHRRYPFRGMARMQNCKSSVRVIIVDNLWITF